MAEVCNITRIHKKTLRNHAELFLFALGAILHKKKTRPARLGGSFTRPSSKDEQKSRR